MAIKAIINNTEKEIEQIKNSDEQDIDYIYSRIGDTEVEGEPPISIKSIGGNLADYRIYGQTVDGESVGDRTGNLFDVATITEGSYIDKYTGNIVTGSTASNVSDFISVIPNSTYTLSYAYTKLSSINRRVIGFYSASKEWVSFTEYPPSESTVFNINVPNDIYYIKITTDNKMTNIMLNAGSTALPYEPYGYRVPVTVTNGTDAETTNIYLPEPIKIVGDEAEYIDYAEQKQHRVRKNLLQNTATSQTINGVTFTVNSDGSVTCNGTASANAMKNINLVSFKLNNFILNGCPTGGGWDTFQFDIIQAKSPYTILYRDVGTSVSVDTLKENVYFRIRIASGYTCNNLTFYPMIRNADITDDTYEPYIENTDVDVALPALSTIKGTNTLSVNTSIQPSNIYVKDNFDYKKVFTATRVIEDELPLSYRSIEDNDSALKNYRIYGQTIDGESVGDRTRNLFDGEFLQGCWAGADGSYLANYPTWICTDKLPCKPNTAYTLSFNSANSRWYGFFWFAENGDYISSDTVQSPQTQCHYTATSPSNAAYMAIDIAGYPDIQSRITPSDVTDFMLVEGSTALPYEPYGYKVPVTTERSAPHTATLQLHDCLPSIMQFDAPEALYYAENGLTAGTYCFTIQNYDTTYGGGKTYNFTLTNDVPVGGQLTFGWSYNTQAINAKIISYESSTSTTEIEQVSVSEGSTGINLGTTDGNSTNVNHIHRVRYGSNNYGESAVRQFLNSNAIAGNVWTPQTKFDRPPVWNANIAGFMNDIDCDFLAALGVSHKITALNTVIDDGGYVVLDDKFFLLSRSEVYGGKENNIDEGEPYPYYSNYSDLSAACTGNDSNRIKYKSGTAQWWWLRSPHFANGNYVRSINPTGSVSGNSNANIVIGVAPACNIALDEDNKFNGQVLHVRDQISVTKGNQTLVFDVIGIDHDEVHFDKTTVDIYLDEQIKMVGNEAEYVDYKEQKQHRVRKNLLKNTMARQIINGVTFTANEDGSITCNGTAGASAPSVLNITFTLPIELYEVSGCPDSGGNSTYRVDIRNNDSSVCNYNGNSVLDYGTGCLFDGGNNQYCIRIAPGYTCNNLTFYPMIRKADIEDDTYEPYIENTDLDVTLPALPTLPGTNTLSVGTEVQPSRVYLKGKIKEIN